MINAFSLHVFRTLKQEDSQFQEFVSLQTGTIIVEGNSESYSSKEGHLPGLAVIFSCGLSIIC